MNFIAIIAALALEQWRGLRWRGAIVQLFRRYARALERRFNGGAAQQGAMVAAIVLVPPVLFVAAAYWLLLQVSPLLAAVWSAAVLWLVVGFRQFSHAYAAIAEALKADDAIAAR